MFSHAISRVERPTVFNMMVWICGFMMQITDKIVTTYVHTFNLLIPFGVFQYNCGIPWSSWSSHTQKTSEIMVCHNMSKKCPTVKNGVAICANDTDT